MSFQLIAFKAYGLRVSATEQRMHVKQRAMFQIAAANTDVALDIASATTGSLGTFWTAVTTDATYGNIGTQALYLIQQIQAVAVSVAPILNGPLATYLQVASGPTGNQFTLSITNNLPTITWVSGSAPTSYIVELEWFIHDGLEALSNNGDLGASL